MSPKQYPPYRSDSRIHSLISLAASTTYNPRGLESPYYSCYVTAFQDLLRPVSDDLHVSTQTAISIPGRMVREKEHERQARALELERSQIATTPPPEAPTDGRRFSHRKLTDTLVRLVHRSELASKVQCRLEENKVDMNIECQISAARTSLDRPTQPDSDAKDGIPDLLVMHIGWEVLREPALKDFSEKWPTLSEDEKKKKFQDIQYRHKLRAGVRVVDLRLVLIGEIKSLNHTSETPEFHEGNFTRAVKEVMVYCAMHLDVHPESEFVVAFVAVGPYWQWRKFKRDSVPALDPTTCEVDTTVKGNKLKAKKFSDAFINEEENCHFLGSSGSDTELERIRRKLF